MNLSSELSNPRFGVPEGRGLSPIVVPARHKEPLGTTGGYPPGTKSLSTFARVAPTLPIEFLALSSDKGEELPIMAPRTFHG